MHRFAATVFLAFVAVTACAPAAPPAPQPAEIKVAAASTADQAAILAALAPSIQRELDQSVAFKNAEVKTAGDWAWVKAVPTAPTGDAIDYSHTTYAERAAGHDLDSDTALVALLQREAGAWVVRDFEIGATAASWAEWSQKYGAPAELMGPDPAAR